MRLCIDLPDNWEQLLAAEVGQGAVDLAKQLPATVISAKALVLNGMKSKIAPELEKAGVITRITIEASEPGDPVYVIGPLAAGGIGLGAGLLLSSLLGGD